jgi:hypothetical protein
MEKIKFIILFSIITIVSFSSCSDDVDTQNPVIKVNQPRDHDNFHTGDVIEFDAEFSDNQELSEMKIDIHYAGDGHTHKSFRYNGEVEWDWDTIIRLAGQFQHVQFSINIPDNAKHGEYDFLVFCTDKAGNESFVVLDFDIEKEENDPDHK